MSNVLDLKIFHLLEKRPTWRIEFSRECGPDMIRVYVIAPEQRLSRVISFEKFETTPWSIMSAMIEELTGLMFEEERKAS